MQQTHVIATLKTGSALVIAFGGIVALASFPPTAGVVLFLVDLIKWPLDGAQNIDNPEFRFLSAVSGGVMVGWGVLLWLVSTRLYPQDPGLARIMILTSVGVWFVVDGIGSIVSGTALNAVLNISFLVLFTLPLLARPHTAAPQS